MTIEQAVTTILGRPLAEAIIDSQGVHWAVVAAIANATVEDDPAALDTLEWWLAEAKQDIEGAPS